MDKYIYYLIIIIYYFEKLNFSIAFFPVIFFFEDNSIRNTPNQTATVAVATVATTTALD